MISIEELTKEEIENDLELLEEDTSFGDHDCRKPDGCRFCLRLDEIRANKIYLNTLNELITWKNL